MELTFNGKVENPKEKLEIKNERLKETSILTKVLKENDKYLRKSKKIKKITTTSQTSIFSQLYRYADIKDVLLMIIGLFASISNGIMLPTMSLFFGGLANVFISQEKYANDPRYKTNITIDMSEFETFERASYTHENDGLPPDFITEQDFFEIVDTYTLYFVYLGLIMFISGSIQCCCWETASANQICKLRQIYFAQTLRQDLSWYDESEDGDLTIKITDDLERMRDGLGSKVPILSQAFTTLIAGMVIGFITSWKLSLVILSGGPVILIASAVNAKITKESAMREQLRYGIAGGIASEIINSIRTVTAFGTQKEEIDRFDVALIEGKKATAVRYYYLAGAMGISVGFLYLMYGIGVYYGSKLFLEDEITPGQIFTVFMSIITGAFGIGNALPLLSEVANAFGAATNVFGIIDNIPKIDPYSCEGQALDKVEGKIELNNVYFSYPTRPEIMVLSGLDLTIKPGQVVALVGSSGSGKSTVINLLLRFYDPLCGNIFIDNVNIKDLNVESLRKNLGVVSQEPVLFDVSIEENIRYGNANATEYEIKAAAKLSNAHNFIENMPQGYDTIVGERGVQLSGGQKQRIAIARALISNPKILLLDEATSALDAHSEATVQAALENAMKGRTTIIIAHRLSTVRNADVIYAMQKGRLMESGTHDELMNLKGVYYNLVLTQSKNNADNSENINVEPPSIIKRYSIKRKSSRRKSMITVDIEGKENEEEEEVEELEVSYFDLIQLNTDKLVLTMAIISCIIAGFHVPCFSILYGGILKIFVLPINDFENAVALTSGMFALLAFVSMTSLIIGVLTTSISSENMIKELRLNIFKNLLSQEISLFDETEYSPTKVINLLARDPPLIKCIAGMRAGHILLASTTLVLSVVIAFYCGWQLALIVTAFIPLLMYGNWKQGKMRFSSFIKESEATEQATKLAAECLGNIKTVQSLCLQEHMVNIFAQKLLIAHKDEKKHGYIYGFTYAISTSMIFFLYACAYRFGATFISEQLILATNMYRAIFAIAFAATAVGAATVFFLDFSKGKVSVTNAVRLMHVKTTLNPFAIDGLKPEIKGKIEFKNIWFSYPTRRNQKILKGFDLSIESGETVALVGGSGCGKSTIISLLERFYFPDKGSITLDGVDITEINTAHLRNNLGLVTQEPTLFDTSIRENIAYGAKSLNRLVTEQEIIQAAKASNIHEFIVSLPQGYDTKVGDRGSKLSGGQKQRVAIARALIRNPKILLLDEATSALDTESEKIVQIALDKAREGRTCIIIAHRLSTIQNADKIAVIHNGVVAELGTHEQLKAFGGLYYDLIKNQ